MAANASRASAPTRVPLTRLSLLSVDQRGGVEIRPSGPDQQAFLQLEFSEPFEARSLTYNASPLPEAPPAFPQTRLLTGWKRRTMAFSSGKSATSMGGAAERKRWRYPGTASFPAVQAKFYRIVSLHALQIKDVRLSGAARVPHWTRQGQLHSQPRIRQRSYFRSARRVGHRSR